MGVPSPLIRQNGTAPGAMTPSHNTGNVETREHLTNGKARYI
jgi:hypothetical protein